MTYTVIKKEHGQPVKLLVLHKHPEWAATFSSRRVAMLWVDNETTFLPSMRPNNYNRYKFSVSAIGSVKFQQAYRNTFAGKNYKESVQFSKNK